MDRALHSMILGLLTGPGEVDSPNPTRQRSTDGGDTTGHIPASSFQADGAEYNVLDSLVDIVLKDDTTDPSVLAARVIFTVRRATAETGGEAAPAIEVAAHAFLWASGSKVVRSELILDTEALQSRRPTAERASVAPTRPAAQGRLAETYRSYVSAINARQMSTTLPDFCHPTVTHNGRPLALPTYQRLMTDAQTVIPDIVFAVDSLVVDEERGMVAALLGFTGTSVGEFAGVEGTGREVRFGEIVFYWFVEGKISRVVSLVDLDTYRAQARG